jgi:uncharacterized protein
MISSEVSVWTSRVLEQGRLGSSPQEDWKLTAYEKYREKLLASTYPCFFGQSGELRGEMIYTFATMDSLDEVVTNTQRFVNLIGTEEHERCSLVAFFKPDQSVSDHPAFVDHFWRILQFLHEHDTLPATDKTPDHPLWEFSFEGCEMFVVGASPTYRQRRSRNLGAGIVLVFQPRNLFIDPTTSEPIASKVRRRIHKRMLAYEGMAAHPDIGFYGEEANREWKQYALPDDNSPEQGSCPFHTRTQ